MRDGKPLEAEEQRQALLTQAAVFEAERLPLLSAVGIALD